MLASGGRDRLIKVWDTNEEQLLKVVETADAVGRLAWRPLRQFQIASCAASKDSHIK